MEPTISENPFQSPSADLDSVSDASFDAIQLEGTFTVKDLEAAFRAQTIDWMLIPILGAESYLIYYLTIESINGWTTGPFFIASILLSSAWTLWLRYRFGLFWGSRRRQLFRTAEEQQVLLSDEGVRIETHSLVIDTPWTQITRLTSKSRMLLMQTVSGRTMMIPYHFFTGEVELQIAQRNIREWINTADPTVPNVPRNPQLQRGYSFAAAAITGEGHIHWSDILLAQWECLRIRIILAALTIGLLLGLDFYAILRWSLRSPVGSDLPWFFILAPLGIIGGFWWHYFRNLRRRDMPSGTPDPVRWTMDEQMLNIRSPRFSQQIAWHDVTRTLVETERVFLRYGHSEAFVLPRRFFASDEDWRQVVEWARQSQQRN